MKVDKLLELVDTINEEIENDSDDMINDENVPLLLYLSILYDEYLKHHIPKEDLKDVIKWVLECVNDRLKNFLRNNDNEKYKLTYVELYNMYALECCTMVMYNKYNKLICFMNNGIMKNKIIFNEYSKFINKLIKEKKIDDLYIIGKGKGCINLLRENDINVILSDFFVSKKDV